MKEIVDSLVSLDAYFLFYSALIVELVTKLTPLLQLASHAERSSHVTLQIRNILATTVLLHDVVRDTLAQKYVGLSSKSDYSSYTIYI